jgi:signal transduction histidine kinase
VFVAAAVLGLSLALWNPVALQGTIVLVAISATAIAADASSRIPSDWVAVTEAALAALVIGVVLPQGFVLLPYLVAPALIAGVSTGLWSVIAVIAVETLALTILVTLPRGFDGLAAQSPLLAPWLLTSLGLGLLGTWVRQLRIEAGDGPDSSASYESAHRLLSQLRTVARRLSSGLDAVSIATQILTLLHDRLGDSRGAVFVRTEGGVLAPLAYRGHGARELLHPDDALVRECWAEMMPAVGVTRTPQRVVLPLRVGSRMIGVVMLLGDGLPQNQFGGLLDELDKHSLRLDTALAFDEVRSIATMEERHRVAREIHDGVAQEIASLGYVVDELTALESDPKQAQRLHSLRAELSRVVSELRLSIFDLRSEISTSAGLGAALSDYVRAVGARSDMTVHLSLDEAPTRLRGEIETELLRIAQEAITNARKHSGADNLWVDCRIHPPFARIHIRDDGAGLGKPREDSYGLRIMRERAQRINALLEIVDGVECKEGTSVTVTVGSE